MPVPFSFFFFFFSLCSLIRFSGAIHKISAPVTRNIQGCSSNCINASVSIHDLPTVAGRFEMAVKP